MRVYVLGEALEMEPGESVEIFAVYGRGLFVIPLQVSVVADDVVRVDRVRGPRRRGARRRLLRELKAADA